VDQISRIGMDTSKHIFQLHGVNTAEEPVLRKKLRRKEMTRAFAVVNYEQAVEPFLKTDRLSDTERAMLMGGATAKAYGWSPKKG
jgi:hypothetical protein